MVTTGERMTRIETQIEDVKEGLKTHMEEQRQDFDKVFKKLDEMHTSFAGKWVEKVTVGMIVMILGSVTVYAITHGL